MVYTMFLQIQYIAVTPCDEIEEIYQHGWHNLKLI